MSQTPKPQSTIQIWDSNHKKFFNEKVYGEQGMKWLYSSKLFPNIIRKLITHKSISKAVGLYYSTSLSKKLITPFVQKFGIIRDDFIWDNFKSFNDFFIRKYKPELRRFSTDAHHLCAPAEGRVYAFDSSSLDPLPVKGSLLSVTKLLEKSSGHSSQTDWSHTFKDGPALIFRLCPVDYHRYHYPCDGKVIDHYRSHGPLESVHPHALKTKNDILFTNERAVSILESPIFGKLAYIEVGALFVGSMIQSHTSSMFKKGEEKGYFLFGGSTVILLGEKDKWHPSQELLQKTNEGFETYIQLGQIINK